jgi:galactokinase
MTLAFAVNGHDALRMHSVDYGASRDVSLKDLCLPGGSDWHDYISGVFWAFQEEGHEPCGLDIVVAGTIPIGAGLSSSAALELATARAVSASIDLGWEPKAMALVSQKAENEWVGMSCGIMDQLAVAAGEEGGALLLDCRSLDYEIIPIPKEALVVVMDTGTRRALVDGEYNARRSSCESAVRFIQQLEPSVRALRDVSTEMLSQNEDQMDRVAHQRAQHVVEENQRTTEMARALQKGDLRQAGHLMNASHESLRDLYEVSSRDLDIITRLAREHSACFGARMTGAGFGGCGVALVQSEHVEAFTSDIETTYKEQAGQSGSLYVCRPVRGTHLV